ncbi:hypothetical protein [Streptomyces sp. CRN 30]|uniref:hypothetical protein n=1 Tax=Streptomyces sp. CRN 30 TaxID=3075613 RepID=UPI002A831E36|nr:hypothetical protein [Streptomyces sp. CRN 30]
MAQQEPDTGDAPRSAGDSVWRRRLPWQQDPLGDAGELGAGPGSSPPATEGEDESATPRGRLTRHLLTGAVGLSLLVLVVPVVLLDGSDRTRRPDAGGPTTGDLTLDQPPPPAASPEATTTAAPAPSRDTSATPRARDTPAPGPETVPVGLTAPRTTPAAPTGTPAPARRTAPAGVIHGTSVLEPGQSWTAGRAVLTFQDDGNLVLHDRQGRPRWQSGTVGQGARTVFQGDGNLVVYAPGMRPVWSTRTDGHDGAELVLGGDGGLTVRHGTTVLWSARTTG